MLSPLVIFVAHILYSIINYFGHIRKGTQRNQNTRIYKLQTSRERPGQQFWPGPELRPEPGNWLGRGLYNALYCV